MPTSPPDAKPDGVVLALAVTATRPRCSPGSSRGLPQAELLTGDGILVGQPLVAAAGSRPRRSRRWRRSRRPGRSRVLTRIARDAGRRPCRSGGALGLQAVRVVRRDPRGPARRGARPTAPSGSGGAHAARARSPIGTYQVRRNGAVEGLPMALYRLRGDRFEVVRTLF